MGVILRALPVRGESHIQHSANQEVATTSPPFYNEPHQSHVLFVKAAPGMTFTSWSQHHFVAIRKLECGKLHTVAASNNSSRSSGEITLLLLVRATYIWVLFFRALFIRGELHIQRNANREVATLPYLQWIINAWQWCCLNFKGQSILNHFISEGLPQWFPNCGTRKPSRWYVRPFCSSTQKECILFSLVGFVNKFLQFCVFPLLFLKNGHCNSSQPCCSRRICIKSGLPNF